MAQAASLMMLTTPRCSGQIVYFVGIREARFFKAVLPGAVVELTGSVVSMRHGVIESSMEAWTGGVRAAAAILTCTFRPHRSSSDLKGQVGG
jgi:3-hydroxymyristoyl/3-hydroxydecanoyl-(acyl carrier protein) dehydratase